MKPRSITICFALVLAASVIGAPIGEVSLADIEVSDFEVLAFDAPIELTDDCVRAD
jgi:hypothetical protein